MFGLFKISNRKEPLDNRLSDLFPSVLFWDVDINDLSPDMDKDFIIQRVLSRHMNKLENLENLERIYSKKVIKSFAKKSSEIFGNENIEFLANYYGLKPQSFKKYIPNITEYA